MNQKRNKRIMVILSSLMSISLVWALIFILPIVSVEAAGMVLSSQIIYELEHIYWSGIPSLVSIPISFANGIYAIKGLHSIYKEKTSTQKRIIGYLIYMIISLGTVIIHCITFDYVFSSMISG